MEQGTSPNYEARISTVEAGLDAVKGQLDDVSQDIRGLDATLQAWRRDENNARRPQYIGLATLVVAVLAVTISFGVLITTPHVAKLDAFEERDSEEKTLIHQSLAKIHDSEVDWLKVKLADYEAFGRVKERVLGHDEWMTRLEMSDRDLLKIVHRNEGVIEMLREQLSAVDHGGSRKWIKDSQ
jgi:hypothetical protein